ncbi:hypothetical protein CLOACE_08470 [Clostridium acetireducens DSM 10703]|uniref:DUF3796 domain-containing protein n=1 Tax=Clostridium acetireducens DSM 10703 TaxID=1121290 RepID=A0A1E8EZZ4_9CLOT|nr:DUF3796 domain-containing protein [Clostridium acetireducens]OFI06692.1 hypothetical protein CLOACE_08470 [Clostridium acetireducens DSM 10703]
MKKTFRIHPVFGILGFLGILGIIYNPFFCIFFGFFSFFWWGLIGKEKSDERLEENINKAVSIAGRLALILCFFILFALDKKVASETVLLAGSIGYAIIFTLAPALAYFIDKRG